MIIFSGKIDTEHDEELIFKALNEFMKEQFQKFEFGVSGKTKSIYSENGKEVKQ